MATKRKQSRGGSRAGGSKARGGRAASAGRSASARSAASGARSTAGRRSATRGRPAAGGNAGSARPLDAIRLLKQDHREVEKLLAQFENARSNRQQEIAEQICRMLTVHAQIEEEIFYPAARQALKDEDLIDEAEVEHQSAKDLIAQIQGASADDKFEAKVKVLGEYVKHHVKEEENQLFRQLNSRRIDLAAIGEQLMSRKQQLLGQADRGTAGSAGVRVGDMDEDADETAYRGNGARSSRHDAPALGARGAGRRGGRRG